MIVKNRIKKHSEFQNVIQSGKLERSDSFNMYFMKNTYEYTRIGISVPKKSGNAVIRNKIKRQVRAMCSKIIDFNQSLDIVLVIRKAYDVENYSFIMNELEKLIKKIG